MRIISVCLVFLLLLFLSYGKIVFAQESTPSAEVSGGKIDEAILETVPIRFLPSHPLYFLITVKENVNRFFRPSAAERAEFDFVLSGKRLKETYLLIEENKVNRAKKNLLRYVRRSERMTEQIEKARSQNQDIAKQIDVISEGFQYQETFLTYFSEQSPISQQAVNSIGAFRDAVNAVDKIKPGIKNRFKILINLQKSVSPSPDPIIDTIINEATPSVRPRQIIL